MMENPHLTFILGGARSGKSVYAESLISRHAPPWTYIATAQPFDAEMRARIDLHRSRRGDNWRVIEAPQELPQAIRDAAAAPLLVDCLAIWLSNRMHVDADLAVDRAALLAALAARTAPTVVVSPEVGLSIVPENALARAFRDAAGLLHQDVAKISASLFFVVAGYPLKVKA